MSDPKQIGVGVAVVIMRDSKILLGLRKSELGRDTWAPPGGKMDFNERVFDTAIREAKEETGLIVEPKEVVVVGNDRFEGTHFITISVLVKEKDRTQEPRVLEPEKCERWEWFNMDGLPERLFVPARHTIEGLKTGAMFLDKSEKNEEE